MSVITNFGCHYKCPYCIVKENNLHIPIYDCYRVVYHANTLEQLSHIRRTGNEIVRAVAEYTIKDIALFVKNSPDIDELSFRQLVEEYLRMGHKKLWWYIEQNDYNLYYAENQVSTRYRDFEKEVQKSE